MILYIGLLFLCTILINLKLISFCSKRVYRLEACVAEDKMIEGQPNEIKALTSSNKLQWKEFTFPNYEKIKKGLGIGNLTYSSLKFAQHVYDKYGLIFDYSGHNGFLYVNGISGANGLKQYDEQVTILTVEKRTVPDGKQVGVCNSDIMRVHERDMNCNSCLTVGNCP